MCGRWTVSWQSVISKVGCSDIESGQVHFPSVKSNFKRVSFRIAGLLIDMFLLFFLDILLAVQSSWDLNLISCLQLWSRWFKKLAEWLFRMGLLSSWSCLFAATSASSCCLPSRSWRSTSGSTGAGDALPDAWVLYLCPVQPWTKARSFPKQSLFILEQPHVEGLVSSGIGNLGLYGCTLWWWKLAHAWSPFPRPCQAWLMGVVTKPARDSNAGCRSTVLHCCSGPCSVFIRVAEVLRASGSRTLICSTIVFFPPRGGFPQAECLGESVWQSSAQRCQGRGSGHIWCSVNSSVCAEGSWGSVYYQLQAKVWPRLLSWLLREHTEHTANQIEFPQCALEKDVAEDSSFISNLAYQY